MDYDLTPEKFAFMTGLPRQTVVHAMSHWRPLPYHNLRHCWRVCDVVFDLMKGVRYDWLGLAVMYHDAGYNPRKTEVENRRVAVELCMSAPGEDEFGPFSRNAKKVAARVIETDDNKIFHDADWEVFRRWWVRPGGGYGYSNYAAEIEREFCGVGISERAFVQGRYDFLRGIKGDVFRLRKEWNEQARANIEAECATLRKRGATESPSGS